MTVSLDYYGRQPVETLWYDSGAELGDWLVKMFDDSGDPPESQYQDIQEVVIKLQDYAFELVDDNDFERSVDL